MNRSTRRLIALACAGGTATLAAAFALGAPASAADPASVSVVHGIPKTPVNVFVNGKITLKNFQPGKVAGPLSVPAGTYKVTVFAASNTKGTGTPVISASAAVQAGGNYTLVAHLTAAGKPTITPYQNDTAPVAAGKARLVVRHDAAAPAVDVRANGQVAFRGLTNPRQAQADLPAGSLKADVVLAGTSTVAIGPAMLDLREGTSTIVYAYGSAQGKTLGVAAQTISGLHSAPTGVPAGTGGLLDRGTTPMWVPAASVAGMLIALAGAAGLFRTARPARRSS